MLKISRVVLGSMGLSDLRQADVTRILHTAIDCGVTSIDTAPLYGAGRSEVMIGRAISNCRQRVQILTKCGLRWDGNHGARMFEMPVNGEMRCVRKDSRPASIAQDIDESLKRLSIETIDLVQIHQLDFDSPLGECLEALETAKAAGKIRAIGVSNFPLRKAESANQYLNGKLFSVQDEFSLASRVRSAKLLGFCQRSNTRFLAYSPLAQGVLSGKYLDLDARSAAQLLDSI